MTDSNDFRTVFMLAPDGMGDGVPLLIVAIPKAAWEHMKDTKTSTINLTMAGLPIKLMMFGCDDRAHALRLMEEWNAEDNRPTHYDDRDFGI